MPEKYVLHVSSSHNFSSNNISHQKSPWDQQQKQTKKKLKIQNHFIHHQKRKRFQGNKNKKFFCAFCLKMFKISPPSKNNRKELLGLWHMISHPKVSHFFYKYYATCPSAEWLNDAYRGGTELMPNYPLHVAALL